MRLFVSALAAVVLLSLSLPSGAADTGAKKRDDSVSEKMGMKLSLQCYTYRKLTFFETVDKAKELGIRYLEIYPKQTLKPGSKATTERTMSDETIAEIKKKLADSGGMKLVAYGVAPIPTDEAGARKNFEWAKKMGIEVLVTETTPNEIHNKLCQEFNIKIALHNHPKTWPPDAVLKACNEKGKLIGSCSDTGHWMRANYPTVATLKQLEGRIMHLHFKDLNGYGKDVPKPEDVPWGTGKGDAKGMLAELKRQGYQGYMSIEYETGTVDQLDKNLPMCVAFWDKTVSELAK